MALFFSLLIPPLLRGNTTLTPISMSNFPESSRFHFNFLFTRSVERSVPDEDGLRHVLLCRVILGRPELVPPGSDQTHPSSDEFDSGVDRFENPNKYIIWSTDMNTHILPEFVVSFRAADSSTLRGTFDPLFLGC